MLPSFRIAAVPPRARGGSMPSRRWSDGKQPTIREDGGILSVASDSNLSTTAESAHSEAMSTGDTAHDLSKVEWYWGDISR